MPSLFFIFLIECMGGGGCYLRYIAQIGRQTQYVAQENPKLLFHLTLPPRCWGYRPPHPYSLNFNLLLSLCTYFLSPVFPATALFCILSIFRHPFPSRQPSLSPASEPAIVSSKSGFSSCFSLSSSLGHSGRLCCALALRGQSGPSLWPSPLVYIKRYMHILFISVWGQEGQTLGPLCSRCPLPACPALLSLHLCHPPHSLPPLHTKVPVGLASFLCLP